MKRTLLFIVAFFVLAVLVIWSGWLKKDDKTTLAGADRAFAVENIDRVYKIFLADRQGNQTTLERKEGYWLYNGRWKARPNATDNLLDAVRRVQIQYKPPTAAVPNMIKSLASEGIKVELYDNKGSLMKTYYVGGATADERGTYMIMEDAEQPYVVHLPGWEGNVRFRYNLKGVDWRDKTVFARKTEQIRSVSVEYPKQKNLSFRLEKTGKDYLVTPFYEITPKIQRPVRQGSAEAFLLGFENLVAEGFENDNPKRDSISRLVPFSIITLTDTEGRTQEVKLFPIFPQGLAQDPKTGEWLPAGSLERYFADCSSGDFMLVQHRLFKKILWGYPFFFE